MRRVWSTSVPAGVGVPAGKPVKKNRPPRSASTCPPKRKVAATDRASPRAPAKPHPPCIARNIHLHRGVDRRVRLERESRQAPGAVRWDVTWWVSHRKERRSPLGKWRRPAPNIEAGSAEPSLPP